LASNHYVTKRNRRPKNRRRKDYTRETMLKLRKLSVMDSILTVEGMRNACEILSRHSSKPVNGMFVYYGGKLA
jgi:hypothetical protein